MLGFKGVRMESSDNTSNREPNHKELSHEPVISFAKLILYGMATASFAIIIAFLNINSLDWSLRITLGCYSLTLPLSIVLAFSLDPSFDYSQKIPHNKFLFKFYNLCLAVFFIGTMFLFFHFSWIYTVLFLAASLISPYFVRKGGR